MITTADASNGPHLAKKWATTINALAQTRAHNRRVRKMKTHSNLASRVFGILAIVGVGWLQPTAAYGQTAEGTVIDNIATVSFTDANSNTYSTVQDNVTVTVGFSAGMDVVASQATATPASPSTLNTIDFVVKNIGNGTDSVTVSEGISDGTVLTVTKYTFNAADYANITLLNVALAGTAIAAGGSETITVEYTIASNKGGQPSTYTLTANSRRTPATTDNDNTVVTPGLTGTVATTPDGGQSLTHLPSGGASPNYTFTFNVANNQNGVDDFNLVATTPGSVVITIVSVDGVIGSSATISALAAGANQDIDVIYTVADVAAGSLDSLYLAATSVANGATNNTGFADMTVIKAALTITKQAWDDGRGAQVSADVLPGMFIEYRIEVSNTGTAAASNVHIDDILPAEVTYISASPDAAGWTFSNTLNDFDADLTGGPLAPAATRFFWIRVQIN